MIKSYVALISLLLFTGVFYKSSCPTLNTEKSTLKDFSSECARNSAGLTCQRIQPILAT